MVIALGVLANIFFVIGGFFREPKHSMIMVIFGNLIFAMYYIAMELYSPIFSVITGALVCLLIVNTQCAKRIKLISISGTCMICLLLILNFSSLYDVLLILAAIAIACAQMNKSNYIRYKFFVLISQSLWITFCLHFSDYAMLCTCVFIVVSNIWALISNLHKDGLLSAESLRQKLVFVNKATAK